MTQPPPSSPAGIAPGFLKRLSYYLVGITIGLVMLGLMHQARKRAAASAPTNAAQPIDAPPSASPTRPSDEQGG